MTKLTIWNCLRIIPKLWSKTQNSIKGKPIRKGIMMRWEAVQMMKVAIWGILRDATKVVENVCRGVMKQNIVHKNTYACFVCLIFMNRKFAPLRMSVRYALRLVTKQINAHKSRCDCKHAITVEEGTLTEIEVALILATFSPKDSRANR